MFYEVNELDNVQHQKQNKKASLVLQVSVLRCFSLAHGCHCD